VLASVPGQTFRWQDVSRENQRSLQQLDGVYYNILRSEAEFWAENLVLAKEAASSGVTVDELVKSYGDAKDKKQWVEPLFVKYGVKFKIQPPKGSTELQQAGS